MTLNRRTMLTLASALPLGATASNATAAGRPLPPDVAKALRTMMATETIPGLAFGIVRHGDLASSGCFGLADIENDVPVTADTIFQSGSVGKQFTAATAMTLVEDGRLGLDAPVAKYLPECPATWARITPRMILQHVSGVSSAGYLALDLHVDYSDRQILDCAFDTPLDFEPGSQWRYSNCGYAVLGIMIGRIAGRPWYELLAQHVLRPAGMTTARIISQPDIVPHRSRSYILENGAIRNEDWVSPSMNRTADGAVYLSLKDFAAWARVMQHRTLLSDASWRTMMTPVRLSSGTLYPYGFGLQLADLAGHRAVHHAGGWQGYTTYIANFTDRNVGFVLLANQGIYGRIVDYIPSISQAVIAGPA